MRKYVVLMVLALIPFVGCSGRKTRQAYEESQKVGRDSQRAERIPDRATPQVVESVMGRGPDTVQQVDGNEVHYYLIEGAVDGEALRLVFKDGQLIGRSIVMTKSMR